MRCNVTPLFFALLLHGVLLLFLLMHDNAVEPVAGIPTTTMVTAFIARTVTTHTVSPAPTAQPPVKPTPPSTTVPSFARHTHGDDKLAERLHTLIEAQQRYPDDALFAEVTGNAVVQFLLHPDGRVSDVRLIASAGFASLDRAAIMAVHAISPVDQVTLALPTLFTVNVEFVQNI